MATAEVPVTVEPETVPVQAPVEAPPVVLPETKADDATSIPAETQLGHLSSFWSLGKGFYLGSSLESDKENPDFPFSVKQVLGVSLAGPGACLFRWFNLGLDFKGSSLESDKENPDFPFNVKQVLGVSLAGPGACLFRWFNLGLDFKCETPVPEVKKAKSMDRDVALADIEKDKKLSFIKAWEETEKSKAENKAQKQLSAITAWENTKKADIEAKLKQIEEKYDKKKAEYAEKMKNKAGLIHKQAEEKRAMVAAKKSEDDLKAEELAAKHRATGTVPKKLIACFGG